MVRFWTQFPLDGVTRPTFSNQKRKKVSEMPAWAVSRKFPNIACMTIECYMIVAIR